MAWLTLGLPDDMIYLPSFPNGRSSRCMAATGRTAEGSGTSAVGEEKALRRKIEAVLQKCNLRQLQQAHRVLKALFEP